MSWDMSAHMHILRFSPWFYPGYGRLGNGGSHLGVFMYVHKCTDFFCDVWCVINYAVNDHLNVCSTIYFLLKQI